MEEGDEVLGHMNLLNQPSAVIQDEEIGSVVSDWRARIKSAVFQLR